ncbi:hypothetical protein PCE1_000054 [Barthelona sp. PCE]
MEFDDDSTLFVGSIPYTLSKNGLAELFSDFNVLDIDFKQATARSGANYAFVSLSNRRQAHMARKQLHGSAVSNRFLIVDWAYRKTQLYVSNFAPETTIDELNEVFCKFGEIYPQFTKVIYDYCTYGFIIYKSHSGTRKAVCVMNGNRHPKLGHKALRVNYGSETYIRHAICLIWEPLSEEVLNRDVIANHLQSVPVPLKALDDDVTDIDIDSEVMMSDHLESLQVVHKLDKSVCFIHFSDSLEGEYCAEKLINNVPEFEFGIPSCNFVISRNQRNNSAGQSGQTNAKSKFNSFLVQNKNKPQNSQNNQNNQNSQPVKNRSLPDFPLYSFDTSNGKANAIDGQQPSTSKFNFSAPTTTAFNHSYMNSSPFFFNQQIVPKDEQNDQNDNIFTPKLDFF